MPPLQKLRAFFTTSPFKRLLFRLRLIERRHQAAIRKNKNGWMARFMHSSLFSLKTAPFCRGLSIGMFWAFVPMPFQMVPATLFCLLSYANLPIALLSVWISNPLTYIPIFYAQYKIGMWLYADEEGGALGKMDFNDFSDFYNSSAEVAPEFLLFLVKGGLTMAIVCAVLGYVAGYPLSAYLRRHSKRRRR